MNRRNLFHPFALSLSKGIPSLGLDKKVVGFDKLSPNGVMGRLERWALFTILPLALAGCGSRSELTPPPGKSLPTKPLAAETTPTPTELMEPSTQARPGRNDELLKKSEKRDRDEFDLPPPG